MKYTTRAIEFTHNDSSYFLCVLDAKTITNISYVARRGVDDEQGAIQRILNKSRISGIKDFLLNGYLNTILHKIEILGYEGTIKFITDYKSNTVLFTEQDHNNATFCKRRLPKDSEIKPEDFLKHESKYFFDMIRSLQFPYPKCYIKCKSGRIILEEVSYE